MPNAANGTDGLTYEQAGVDIDAADALIARPLVAAKQCSKEH